MSVFQIKRRDHVLIADILYRKKKRIRSPEQVAKRREAARLRMRRLYVVRRAQRLVKARNNGIAPSTPHNDMA